MLFEILVTGITPELSADRAKRIIQGLTQRGTGAYLRTRPAPCTAKYPKYPHFILWPLALYGIHYSKESITAPNARRRLDYKRTQAHNNMHASYKAGHLQAVGTPPSVDKGRPQAMYTLTPSGVAYVQGWVTDIFNGQLIAIDTPGNLSMMLRRQLNTLPGVVVPDIDSPKNPVPYNASTLILMLCWIREQAKNSIWANALTELLDTSPAKASRLLRQLNEAGWLEPDDRDVSIRRIGRTRYYRLTIEGGRLARSYISTLLL